MARIFAAFAAEESGRKSAHFRRKMLQNAQAGLPHGSVRPFGYEPDKITVRRRQTLRRRLRLSGEPRVHWEVP
jgi:DNA invertase Pin-like site-specific DNA recombinase